MTANRIALTITMAAMVLGGASCRRQASQPQGALGSNAPNKRETCSQLYKILTSDDNVRLDELSAARERIRDALDDGPPKVTEASYLHLFWTKEISEIRGGRWAEFHRTLVKTASQEDVVHYVTLSRKQGEWSSRLSWELLELRPEMESLWRQWIFFRGQESRTGEQPEYLSADRIVRVFSEGDGCLYQKWEAIGLLCDEGQWGGVPAKVRGVIVSRGVGLVRARQKAKNWPSALLYELGDPLSCEVACSLLRTGPTDKVFDMNVLSFTQKAIDGLALSNRGPGMGSIVLPMPEVIGHVDSLLRCWQLRYPRETLPVTDTIKRHWPGQKFDGTWSPGSTIDESKGEQRE